MAKRIVDEEMRFSLVINGDSAQKELLDVEKQTRKLTATNKTLRAERDKLRSQGKQNTAEYKKLSASIKQNNATIKTNKSRMKALQEQIGVTGLTMAQLQKRASTLRLQLRNMVPGSAEYKRLQADLTATNQRIKSLATQANAAKFSLGGLANGFNKYAALGASVIAGLTGVAFSIQKVVDFNSELADSMSNVRKTTGLTDDEVNELAQSFGALQTRSSRMELLALAEEGGRLGITGVADLKRFTETANEMNVALGDELSAEQIREVGKATNIFKVGEKNGLDFSKAMQSLGSSINEVSASGANSADFLVDFLKRTAGIGDIANLAAQDIVGMAAAFDELGQSREISATAINKTLISMGENVERFAKVAGVGIGEFSDLLENDANEALIKFLEGLNKGNPSLETMASRLKGIEVGGTRGVQAISALAGNVDLLRERQELANEALEENTSLTDEYNLKNENFAAVIDRIKKSFNGFLAGVKAPLETLIRGFADLFGIVDDASEAFAKQNEQTFKSAQNSRVLARESSRLLEEYKSLTKDGIEPTTEEKERLETITLLLKDRLGESVLMIDEETGAFKLNTEAVKEQIKIKRLQADEEAATLASRLQGTKDAIAAQKEEQRIAQREVELRLKNFKKLNPSGGASALQASSNRVNSSSSAFNNLPGVKELADARKRLKEINDGLSEQIEARDDLTEKLKSLNFTPEDVESFFTPTEGKVGPEEGATKTIGDMSFVYKDGKWIRVRTTDTSDDALASERQLSNRFLQASREAQDAELELMQEGLEKELLLEDVRHQRKIEDLQAQLATESEINKARKEEGDKFANTLLDQNEEINANIESQQSIHMQRRAQILSEGIEDEIQEREEQYRAEQVLIKEERNKQLEAVAHSEKETQRLKDQFRKEDLENEKTHIQELKSLLTQIDITDQFEDFNLDILTEEQKNQIVSRLQVLGLEMSEINLLLAQMQNGGQSAEGADMSFMTQGADILGFSAEQWESMFQNYDTWQDKLGQVVMGMQAAQNAYAMFADFQAKKENERLREFQENNDEEKRRLKDRLDAGYINERQYNDAVIQMDEKVDERKEEIARKQAEREKALALMSIAIDTGRAIMSIWAEVPKFDFGISAGVLTGMVAALGAAQAAMVMSTKGFQDGFYGDKFPVRREQDGKMFNAVNGGAPTSGLVSEPTMFSFLAGEQGKLAPEMIISGGDYAKLTPDLKQTLNRELSTVRGFQDGFYSENNSDTSMSKEMAALLMQNTTTLNRLNKIIDSGIIAKVIANEANARELDEALDKYKKRKESSKL